jgi:hypothetical protein
MGLINIEQQQQLIDQINEKMNNLKDIHSDLEKLLGGILDTLGPEKTDFKLPDYSEPKYQNVSECSNCGSSDLRTVPVQHVLVTICNQCNLEHNG